MTSMASATAYSRVGVPDDGPENPRLYGLLSSFIHEPSLATRVTELVIDFAGKRGGFGHRAEESPDVSHVVLPDVSESDTAYAALRQRVLDLGMDEARTTMMARALQWRAATARVAGRRTRNPGSLALRQNDDARFEAQWQLTAGVLLLSFCENAHTLYLGPLDHGYLLLREYMLRANYGLLPQPALQKLQRVEVLTYDHSGWTPNVELCERLQLVHRLPALQRFSADNAQIYQPNWNLAVPGTSGMTELSITHFDIDHEWVALMLGVPRALQKFTLSVGGVSNTDGGMPMMNKAVVGRSLWSHRKTLTHLDVDLSIFTDDSDRFDEEEDGEPSDWELKQFGAEYLRMDRDLAAATPSNDDDAAPPVAAYGHTIGSLRDFPVLKHLSISIRTLLGNKTLTPTSGAFLADMLPPSLESLTLYGYVRGEDEALDAHVDDLMSRKGEVLGALVEVKGVEETEEDVRMTFGEEPEDEEDLWQGIERDLGWKEARDGDDGDEDEADEEDDE